MSVDAMMQILELRPSMWAARFARAARTVLHVAFCVAFLGSVVACSDGENGAGEVPAVRPAQSGKRPDVFLLVADTFRSDHIGREVVRRRDGKRLALVPALDALAAESVRFRAARAVATWTLPSHASMFSGLYPPELGMVDGQDGLPERAVTIAEQFRNAGYRTAAVTDAGYVSAGFGLAQGFAHFEEVGTVEEADLTRTLRAVDEILARDDGRPLFLFIQSYRPHSWTVDEALRERFDDALSFRPNATFRSPEWRARLLDLLRTAPHGAPMTGPEYEEIVAAMAPNYRGASASADLGFGAVLERLRARGGLDEAVLVFTSDHGESLGEHGVVSHGNSVWDSQARVPFLVRAPGLVPRDDERAVSLLDLPRTLCGLARIEPYEGWRGIDLFGDVERAEPLLIFQTLQARTRYVAALDGGNKLIFRDEGGPRELVFAYDVDWDPAEQFNRVASVASTQLERRSRAFLESVYQSRGEAEAALPSDAVRAQLRQLGYADSEDGR